MPHGMRSRLDDVWIRARNHAERQKKRPPEEGACTLSRGRDKSVNPALAIRDVHAGSDNYHPDSQINIRVHRFLSFFTGSESPWNQAPIKMPSPPIRSPVST